jgi:hypothetical protein
MEGNNKSLEETLIEQGIDKEIFGEYGLELAYRAYMNTKIKTILPRGGSKRKDALEIANNILLGLYTLLTSKTNDNYSFYHILVSSNHIDSSQTTLEESYGAMYTVSDKVKGIKTFFLGIDLNSNANTEMLQLTKAGGEDTIFYNIHNDEIDDIFSMISSVITAQGNLNAPLPGRKPFESREYKVLLFTLDISVAMKENWYTVNKNIDKLINSLGREDLVGGVLFNDEIYIAGNINPGITPICRTVRKESCFKKLKRLICSKKIQIVVIVAVIVACVIFFTIKIING